MHLDGYNLLPAFAAGGEGWPRQEFMYWTDDGDLADIRHGRWKVVFLEQRAHGFDVWQDPPVELRFPKLICLRTDPFEWAQEYAMDYPRWRAERMFALGPAQAFVAKWLESFKQFPPRMEPGSFSLKKVMAKLQKGSSGGSK